MKFYGLVIESARAGTVLSAYRTEAERDAEIRLAVEEEWSFAFATDNEIPPIEEAIRTLRDSHSLLILTEDFDFSGPPKIKIVCETCGSEDVTRDAVVRWSVDTQEWELSNIFDNGDCEKCGETSLEEVAL